MKCAAYFSFLAVCLALADEPKNLLKPTNKVESWRLEQHEGAKGDMKADGDAIVFHATKVDGTDWHFQAVQYDLDLKENQRYVLTFKAKCDATCTIGVNAMIDQEDWHNIGLAEQVMLDKEYHEFEFRFRAADVASKKNRISLVLGNETGTVFIKDLKLIERP